MLPYCRSSLVNKPDIAVATPSRLLSHLQSKVVTTSSDYYWHHRNQLVDVGHSLRILVLDEADLMFSFGYEEDIKSIARYSGIVCTLTTWPPVTYLSCARRL